jgi:predicted nuclease of predicted toxin-antitoxin system
LPQTLLIDENVPRSVVEWLKKKGMKVKGVFDVGLKGARDEKVAEYAVKHNMVILTLDADFAYIYHNVFRGSLTVIVVRVKPPTPDNIIEVLNTTLKKMSLEEFQKKLVIIAKKKIRIID